MLSVGAVVVGLLVLIRVAEEVTTRMMIDLDNVPFGVESPDDLPRLTLRPREVRVLPVHGRHLDQTPTTPGSGARTRKTA